MCILCCNKTLVEAGAGNRELKTVASSKVPSDVKQRHRTQEVRTVHITNSIYCYQDWLILEIRKETVISLVTGQQNSHIALKISSTNLQQCWSSTWIIQLHETFRTNAELKLVATATTGGHVTFLSAVKKKFLQKTTHFLTYFVSLHSPNANFLHNCYTIFCLI